MWKQTQSIKAGTFVCPRCSQTVDPQERWRTDWPTPYVDMLWDSEVPVVSHERCTNQPPFRPPPELVRDLQRVREEWKQSVTEGRILCTRCGNPLRPDEPYQRRQRRGELEVWICSACFD
jgi:hypothetical protein